MKSKIELKTELAKKLGFKNWYPFRESLTMNGLDLAIDELMEMYYNEKVKSKNLTVLKIDQVLKFISEDFGTYSINGIVNKRNIDTEYFEFQEEKGYFFNHIYLSQIQKGDDYYEATILIPISEEIYLKCECNS